MELCDRLLWLFGGMVLGYIIAYFQTIQGEVNDVQKHIKGRGKDEAGFMRYPVLADVLYLFALLVVLWGAFSAQKATNDVQALSEKNDQMATCNRIYLGALLDAVQPRTTASLEQADANAKLQKSWYQFVRFQLHLPPYPEDDQRAKANLYAESLKAFLKAAEESKAKNVQNPYPTGDQLDACIRQGAVHE